MTVTASRTRRHLAAAVTAICVFAGVNIAASSAAADDGQGRRPEKPRLSGPQRLVLLEATAQFGDTQRAVAAGYQPTDECVPGWATPTDARR